MGGVRAQAEAEEVVLLEELEIVDHFEARALELADLPQPASRDAR